jgi:hypothetical protein
MPWACLMYASTVFTSEVRFFDVSLQFRLL